MDNPIPQQPSLKAAKAPNPATVKARALSAALTARLAALTGSHPTPPAAPAPFGLGDAVAVVAKPIARVIDRAVGTDLEHCEGCAKRQAALNQAVPNLKAPFASKPPNAI